MQAADSLACLDESGGPRQRLMESGDAGPSSASFSASCCYTRHSTRAHSSSHHRHQPVWLPVAAALLVLCAWLNALSEVHAYYYYSGSDNPHNGSTPYLDEYDYDPDLTYQNVRAAFGDETQAPKAWSKSEADASDASGSCADGTCSNPDVGVAQDDYYGGADAHIDPNYPYDNCIYEGTFKSFRLNGTEECNLLIQGVDAHADLLAGGLDGVYSLVGCFEGKAVYLRVDSPPQEDRVLFYNPNFGEYVVSVGRNPNEDNLIVYGDAGYVSPIDVPRWHLAAALNSDEAPRLPAEGDDLYYVAAGVSITCTAQDTSAQDKVLRAAWERQEEEHARQEQYMAYGGQYDEHGDPYGAAGGPGDGAEDGQLY